MAKYKQLAINWIQEAIGVLLFAMGIHMFIAYNKIVPGGIAGLATVVNHLLHIPIGVASFFLNVPLLILALRYLGLKPLLRTILTVFEMSFALDFVVVELPIYRGNILVASILGGILMGCGLSMILLSGTTTGGGDLIGRMIQTKYPTIPIGKILLVIDFCVISLSAVIFGELVFVVLGILTMAICTTIVDRIFMSNMCKEQVTSIN